MRIRRLAFSFIVAVTLAVTATMATGWTPLCVLYEPWSPQWIALGCWFGEPDPPPPGFQG